MPVKTLTKTGDRAKRKSWSLIAAIEKVHGKDFGINNEKDFNKLLNKKGYEALAELLRND